MPDLGERGPAGPDVRHGDRAHSHPPMSAPTGMSTVQGRAIPGRDARSGGASITRGEKQHHRGDHRRMHQRTPRREAGGNPTGQHRGAERIGDVGDQIRPGGRSHQVATEEDQGRGVRDDDHHDRAGRETGYHGGDALEPLLHRRPRPLERRLCAARTVRPPTRSYF